MLSVGGSTVRPGGLGFGIGFFRREKNARRLWFRAGGCTVCFLRTRLQSWRVCALVVYLGFGGPRDWGGFRVVWKYSRNGRTDCRANACAALTLSIKTGFQTRSQFSMWVAEWVCSHWVRSLSFSPRNKSLSVASTVLRFLCK